MGSSESQPESQPLKVLNNESTTPSACGNTSAKQTTSAASAGQQGKQPGTIELPGDDTLAVQPGEACLVAEQSLGALLFDGSWCGNLVIAQLDHWTRRQLAVTERAVWHAVERAREAGDCVMRLVLAVTMEGAELRVHELTAQGARQLGAAHLLSDPRVGDICTAIDDQLIVVGGRDRTGGGPRCVCRMLRCRVECSCRLQRCGVGRGV